ncbi:MAG: permease [Clostridia bacterium]|nr:permease [Clostridia bacterium]
MFNWLDNLVTLLVEGVFKISVDSRLGSSIHFFIYDSVKIVILLSIMIFAISFIRSYFPPEKTKKILTKFKGIQGNIVASLLGVVTPFCSCSSVPIFIGFVEGGVPLGLTFSFLITSPIVNEAAIALLLGMFGWKVTLIYVLSGIFVGVIGGIIIGALKLEKYVESYVYETHLADVEQAKMTFKQRLSYALGEVKAIVKRVWIFLLIGIGLGAVIHGYVPEDFLIKFAHENNPFAVIIGVIAGIPLYSNAVGTIPIAQALIAKGINLGTALAFMMAVTAMSLPEMILLKKVIKPRLIAAFVAITGAGIIFVGYLFNWIEHLII